MNNSKYLVGLLAVALLTRLSLLFLSTKIEQLQSVTEGGDAIGYTQLANNLLVQQTFKFQYGGPTAYRMPGYPLLLIVTFSIWQSPLPTQILQILVDLLTILTVYKTGMSITGTIRIPLIAAAVVALNPLAMMSSISLLPETLSVFLITVATYFLIIGNHSIWHRLWATIALTFCIYLKPTTAPIAIILLVTSGVHYSSSHPLNWKAILRAVLPLITVGVLMTPWLVRNLVVMRHFIPLTTSNGSNLYGGNNPQADGGFVSSEPYVLPATSEVESDLIFKKRAIQWIKENPVDFIGLLPFKAARFFWPLSFGTSGPISVPAILFWLILLVTITYHAIVVFGIWILITLRKHYWDGLLLIEILTILLLLSLVAFGTVRFALPGFPVSAIFASIGIETIIHRNQSGFKRLKSLRTGLTSAFLY